MVEGLTFFSNPTKGSCQEGPEDFTASARLTVAPRQKPSSETYESLARRKLGSADHVVTT